MMSALTEKLHGLLTKLKGGEDIAHREVDELIAEVSTKMLPLADKVKQDVAAEVKTLLDEFRVDIKAMLAQSQAAATQAVDAVETDVTKTLAEGTEAPVAPAGNAQPAAPATQAE